MSVELLSPAGNFEKLKSALLFGADAVYLAGNLFGMRAAAGNFDNEELSLAIKYAHEQGKKVYLTVNTMPHSTEYDLLKNYLKSLEACLPDAVIVSDFGVFDVIRNMYGDRLPIHVSTQANVLSAESCEAWHRLGATRVVLARELTLDEIKYIRKNVSKELELECFIHGSMCISYSGRCLISGNLIGRDANMGACAQPCRWNYKMYEIEEEKRKDMRMPVIETNDGTFIMASKDMCMIEHIDSLMESGIDCFKIEGRMRSAYYTACVTNAYRMAIDCYSSGNYEYNPLWKRELESVSHREYGTGYFFDDVRSNAQLSNGNKNICEQSFFGVVEDFERATGQAVIKQRNKFCVGDVAEILSPGKTGKAFTIDGIVDEKGINVDSACHHDELVKIKVPFEVKKGDILRQMTAN